MSIARQRRVAHRLAHARAKLVEWHDAHADLPLFPGDRETREALEAQVERALEELAKLIPCPETPRCLVELKARLVRDHHLSSLWLIKSSGGIRVDLIMVEEGHRGAGHGQRAMEALCAYADRERLYLALTPSNLHGANVRRLRSWYRSLGFKPNRGRHADYRFRDTMLRTPG